MVCVAAGIALNIAMLRQALLHQMGAGRGRRLAILAAADVFGLLVLTLFPFLARRFGKKWWTYVYLAAAPVWYFLITELITGNLFQIQRPYLLLNLGACYLLHILLLIFFSNVKWGLLIGHIAFPVLALVEYYVYRLRGRSFMIQDIAGIRTAGKVMGAYSYEFEFRVGLLLLLEVLSLYVLLMLPRAMVKRFSLARKGVVILLVFVVFSLLSSRSVMSRFETADVDLWDLESNYREKGYLFTLLAEMQYLDQEVPDGYSVEAVEEIAEARTAESVARETGISPENIIVIMNESWADFRMISDEAYLDEITPFIDAMSENTVKGYVHVPVFGAGTPNSEYEVLTGNSMSFFTAGGYAYQLYTSEQEWGMVSTLKSQGYSAVALHPYPAANWNRSIVYTQMGFDEFYSFENWPWEMEFTRAYPNDKTCYDALIDLYQSKEQDEKLFTFLVTMQNHGGYTSADYPSTVELPCAAEYPQAAQYFTLLQESDRAFEELVAYFSTVEETTMIVMFGDHYPKVEEDFYTEVLGVARDQLGTEASQKLYQTPFVIWTNYEITEDDGVEISGNYFGSYIMELAGVEMPEYNWCLLDIYSQIPVIGYGMVMDAQGDWYALGALPEDLEAVINKYQILQYNNVFGGIQRKDDVFTLPDSG